MVNSGHKPDFMKRILKAGITKYVRRLAASLLSEDDPHYTHHQEDHLLDSERKLWQETPGTRQPKT